MNNEFTKKQREDLVKIGKELFVLTETDIKYIMDPKTSEIEASRRMHQRIMDAPTEYQYLPQCYGKAISAISLSLT